MIKPFDYLKLLEGIETEVLDAVRRMLHSGVLIHGPETSAFENEFAQWLGNGTHCAGVASGTTALHVALWALDIGPGDEVLTVANTCPPTIAAIRLRGAIPRFVDVHPDRLIVEAGALKTAITPKTKCIVVVHLWGSMVDMPAVMKVARESGLKVVEDCAQAVGASWADHRAGTWGDVGCFSFYPTKNLGAYGDAGAVATSDPALAARMRRIRMYGYEAIGTALEEGMNARIHEMQAAILRVKLRHLDAWLARRREIAAYYDAQIQSPHITPVPRHPGCIHAYHQYVVRCTHRDQLADWLRQHDIGFGIHYAQPVHKMPAYAFLNTPELPHTEAGCSQILSLPLQEALLPEEIESVVSVLNRYSPANDRIS